MSGGLRWGFASASILFAVEAVFYLAVAVLQFSFVTDRPPGLLAQLLGGAVFNIIFIGILSLIAGAGYLWILWLIGAQARFRIWAVMLSPIIAAPVLFDLRALGANPTHLFYWLFPAFVFALIVRPPRTHAARTIGA